MQERKLWWARPKESTHSHKSCKRLWQPIRLCLKLQSVQHIFNQFKTAQTPRSPGCKIALNACQNILVLQQSRSRCFPWIFALQSVSSVVSGHWSVTSGHWSLVTGQWLVVSIHRSTNHLSRSPSYFFIFSFSRSFLLSLILSLFLTFSLFFLSFSYLSFFTVVTSC